MRSLFVLVAAIAFCIASFVPGAFASKAAAPAVVDLTTKNFDSVVDGSKHVFVMFRAEWCGHCKAAKPAWEQLAEAYAHSNDVVIAAVDAESNSKTASRFGVDAYPQFKLFKKGAEVSKPVDFKERNRDIDTFSKFVQDNTGVAARIKRERTYVEKLAPHTFEQVAKDASKHVFVSVTASWCGYCKKLKPIWEVLAKTFHTEKDVVIADIDGTTARGIMDEYGVSGFPTLLFFSKDGKAKPITYEGGRTEEDLVAFINSHAGTKRTVGGGLSEDAGTVSVLDAEVTKFAGPDADASVRTSALTAAKDIVAKLGKDATKYAKYYVKVMEKIIDGNAEFAQKETTRLAKIEAKGNITPEKQDDFVKRRNVLMRFIAADPAKAAKFASDSVAAHDEL
ncbi:disulfide isomerase [Ramicandelaber brevisporus]|nr:disulfide isomerase [Ramicandelaber brevisporus]